MLSYGKDKFMKSLKVKGLHNILTIALLACLTSILFIQYQYVYLYYDDFGYCSLSYGYDAGIEGSNMSLSNVIDYVFNSYSHVNGRIFTNLCFTLSAWLGGLTAMRLIMPACCTFIYLLIYRFICDDLNTHIGSSSSQYDNAIIALFLCLSHGLFTISICNYGLYWFAAAYGYIIPFLLFLFWATKNRYAKWYSPIIAFFLCISSEQAVAMTLVFIFYQIIIMLLSKVQINKLHFLSLFAACFGTLLMLLSPASRSRLTNNTWFYEKNLLDKIIYNSNVIINNFFNYLGSGIVILFLLVIWISSIILFVKYKNIINRILQIVVNISTMIIAFIFFYDKKYLLNSQYETISILFIYFIIAFVELFILYLKLDLSKAVWPLVCAASVGMLLIVPELPLRTFIPFIFLVILIGGDYLALILKVRSPRKLLKYSFILICFIPYILFTSQNLYTIHQGYKGNSFVMEYNDCMLNEASDKIKSGLEVNSIKLYRLIDDTYAGQQVYHSGIIYMQYWIDEFYSLPFKTEFIFYDYPTGDNPVSICVEQVT